jgi:hypothetical protein
MRSFFVVPALLMALAPSARADGVVLARATAERGGTWVPCGRIHAVGWVVHELVKVLEGEAPAKRFVGVHSCPDARLRGQLRLVLRSKRPPTWPRISGEMPDLPRYHVIKATPAAAPITRRARRWLGQARPAVEASLKPTGRAGAWVKYGDHLALRFAKDRVVGVRAAVALGMTCIEAAAWLGYPAGKGRGFPLRRRWGCEWPGISERHRLAPGVAGRLRDGLFELWRR